MQRSQPAPFKDAQHPDLNGDAPAFSSSVAHPSRRPAALISPTSRQDDWLSGVGLKLDTPPRVRC
jgi:hypothetical protein